MKCCKKLKPSENPNLKKGLWSPDEDQKLIHFLFHHPNANWNSVPIYAGLQRNGRSCRLRWMNYLRPGLKRGPFSPQEEETILTLRASLGNKWSKMSKHLPGRTDNEIKNYWHSYLKKRFAKSDDPPKLGTHTNSKSNSFADITNSSSADVDHSVPPIPHVSSLPEILFDDWTSQDQEFQQDFDKSTDQLSHGCCQRNEGSMERGETRNDMNSCSIEDIFYTEISYDQIFNFDDGDFSIDDDFMYM